MIRKLVIYERKAKEIEVSFLEGREWDDFVIIQLAAEDNQSLQEAVEALESYSLTNPEKQVLVIPADVDLEIYGVEVEEENLDTESDCE